MSEQITPTPPPVPAGPSVAELQARLADLEKASEGRLRDLQAERQKRQELEARLIPPAPSAAKPDVEDDQVFQVVAPAIERHPVVRRLIADNEQMAKDKAIQYLETKTGKPWSELEKDATFQDKLNAASMRYGAGRNHYETAVRAFENMKRDEELESYRAKDAERTRANTAAGGQSLPPGAPPASVQGGRTWTIQDWKANVSKHEYGQLAETGDITVKDGMVIHTPRPQ